DVRLLGAPAREGTEHRPPRRRVGRAGDDPAARLGRGDHGPADVAAAARDVLDRPRNRADDRGRFEARARGDSLMTTSWLIAAALVGFQPPQEQGQTSSVVAPGAKIEKVFGEGEFTEGGAMDADGSILFSDIGNRILRYDPKTGKTTIFREPSGRAN